MIAILGRLLDLLRSPVVLLLLMYNLVKVGLFIYVVRPLMARRRRGKESEEDAKDGEA